MNSRCALLAFVVATVLVPASARGMASAELYGTKAYIYGRFEARIQFAPGDGVVSSFFLWKEGSDAANAYWNELDYEKVGADCHMQINSIYGNPKSQHQQTPSLSSICTAYHDYRFEWTPTYIAWAVDGKEIRRDTGADATAYAQNASAGMTMHFNIWPGNSTFGGNINNTTLPVHQYLSWVQYSSYDNGNFNVQWREEFQTSGIPSGWAVGNWASPYNLSTHNAQNVAFVNGIAVLSLSADNATGSPGTPPADTSAGGTSGSGGSSGSGGVTSTGGSGTGGTTASGGATGSGGRASTGGAGGSSSSGGAIPKADGGAGGATASGGTLPSGGTTGAGGSTTAGGTTGVGGGTIAAGSGGATTAGGTTGVGGGTIAAGSGGVTSSGGTTPSGGVTASGGTTESGGSTTTGGGTPGTQAGCSCSTANRASPLGSALLIFLILISMSRLHRKES